MLYQFFRLYLVCALALFSTNTFSAADHSHHSTAPTIDSEVDPGCGNGLVEPNCAIVATPTFDSKGKLWVIWTTKDHVYVSQSSDDGISFDVTLLITEAEFGVANSQEARPLIEIAPNGDIYVLFRLQQEAKRSGFVYFSRSTDGGLSFSKPMLISDEENPTYKAFHAMTLEDNGVITIAWLDKRDSIKAKQSETAYNGSAIYFSQSYDRGESFGENKKVMDYTCQCCRTMLENKPTQGSALVWRNIFGDNIRDHGIASIENGEVVGDVARISDDNWYVEACPHHGPSLSINSQGQYHTTWFSGGGNRKGVFYANSTDNGVTFSTPMQVGNKDLASHAYVLSGDNNTVIAWKEFNGELSQIKAMISPDNGKSWSVPMTVSTSGSESGHPLLINDGAWISLAWRSGDEGFRLFKITNL